MSYEFPELGTIFTGDFAAAAQHFSDALPFTPIGYVMGFLADEGKRENLVKGARNVFGKVGDFSNFSSLLYR